MRLAMDGFESAHDPTDADPGQFDFVGGTNPWVVNTGTGLSDTAHNFGGCYAVKCAYTAHGVLNFVDDDGNQAALSEFYFRGYVLFSGGTNTTFGAIHLFANTTDVQNNDTLAFKLDDNFAFHVKRGGYSGTTLAQSSNNIVTTGQWYRLDYYVKIANSGGRARVKIDGVTVIDFTGDTQGTATTYDRVIFWGHDAPAVYHDDAALNDLTGSVNDGELPVAYIVPLLSSNGSLAEQPPNDSTYEEISSGVRVSSGVAVPAASLVSESPVCLWVRCKGVASAGSVQPYLRVNGSNFDSPAQVAPATDWKYVRYIWNLNPDTNDPWTLADVNALEFGLKSASGTVRVSGMFLEVEGTGGSSCDDEELEPEDIDEYVGDDLTIPPASGLPTISAENVDEMTYAVEDPGGFADGFLRTPLEIDVESPRAHLDDITVTYGELVLYQGRIEPITRDSDADGMWVRYGTSGWQRHMIADQQYWGKLQQLGFDAFQTEGVNTVPYLDQISHSVGFDSTQVFPLLRVTAPAGTSLQVPSGVYQFLIQTDPYGPNPDIRRLRFRWRASQLIAGARFQIIAYAPAGALSTPTVVYNEPHATTDQIVSLYPVGTTEFDTGEGEPGNAVLPAGTWRILVRPIAFTLAVSTIPEPGLVVGIASPANEAVWCYGEMATISPLRASDVVERVLVDVCPAIDTTTIDETPQLIRGLVYATPTQPRDIVDEMLNFTGIDPLDPTSEWTWGVKEKLPNDKYRFYFTQRRLTVRYQVTGVEVQGLTADVEGVYNRVYVSFIDYLGREQTVVAEQAVTILDDLNLTRELHINTGRLKGHSLATNTQNATLIAETALRESQRPARVGQIRIVGSAQNPQVTDLDAGVKVPFFLVFPGELIRIGDTQTSAPTVEPADDPAVWRIRRGQYQIGGLGPHAILTLGQGSTRLEALLARLQAGQQT